MKRILFGLLVLSASAFGQGSPGILPLWQTRNDTLFLVVANGDTLQIFQSPSDPYMTVHRLRGNNSVNLFPQAVTTQGTLTAPMVSATALKAPFLIMGRDTFWMGGDSSIVGGGLQLQNYKLVAALGGKIDDTSEVSRFMLTPQYVNPNGDWVFEHAYKRPGGSFAGDTVAMNSGQVGSQPDSELVTFGYAYSHLANYPFDGSSPSTGKVPTFTSGGEWTFSTPAGSGGGNNVYFMGVGGIGNPYQPGTVYLYPGAGVSFTRVGGTSDSLRVDASDTMWSYDGSRDTMQLRNGSDYFFKVKNSGTTTILDASGENNAFRINKPLTLGGNLTFGTGATEINSSDGSIYVNSTHSYFDTANLGGVHFGKSTGGSFWDIESQTITANILDNCNITGLATLEGKGSLATPGMRITNTKAIVADTLNSKTIRARNNTLTIVSDTGSGTTNYDNILTVYRDTAKDSTDIKTTGVLTLTATVGPFIADSMHTTLFSLDGTSSGRIRFGAPATAGTQNFTWPSSITANGYLKTDVNGVLSWATVSGTGNGVASSKFDISTDTSTNVGVAADSNILWGDGATKKQTADALMSVKEVTSEKTRITSGGHDTLQIVGEGAAAAVVIGTTSGIVTADSALQTKMLIINSTYDTTYRLNAANVDSLKHQLGRFSITNPAARKVYVPSTVVYGRPKAPGTSDSVFLTQGHYIDSSTAVVWDWTDSALCNSADVDFVYQLITFTDTMRVDSLRFLYITSAGDSTKGYIDSIAVFRKWHRAGFKNDTVYRADANFWSATQDSKQLAVNGGTGIEVGAGEKWVVRFRNSWQATADNSVVRVMGLCAQGVER